MRSSGSTYPIILVLLVFQASTSWSLSDKRLCHDPECQDVISIATAKITYTAPEKGLVSFKINSQIRVKSKSAGSDPELWGVEVNGRRGYAPKKFLKEEKVFISDKNLQHIVPVVLADENVVNVSNQNLNPSELSTEKTEKASEPTGITATPPLSKEMEDTPTFLNTSESDVGPTTPPLNEPINANIVNKSLKDTATPVLNKVEIIDGTAIPVAEEIKTQTSKSYETLLEEQKKVTTKNEAVEQANSNEKLVIRKDSKSEKKEVTEKIEAEVLTSAETKANEINIENEQVVESKNSFDIKTEKLVTTEKEKEETINNDNNILKLQDIKEETTVINKSAEEKPTNHNVKEAVKTLETKDNEEVNSTPKSKRKGDDFSQSLSDSNEQVKNMLTQNDNFIDGYVEDDVEDVYVDDEENEKDKVDVDVNDEIVDEPNYKSSSVELTTPDLPKQVTESGFSTKHNMNYWKREEDVATTTPVPRTENNTPEQIKAQAEQSDSIIEEAKEKASKPIPSTEENKADSEEDKKIKTQQNAENLQMSTAEKTEKAAELKTNEETILTTTIPDGDTTATHLQKPAANKETVEDTKPIEISLVPTIPTAMPPQAGTIQPNINMDEKASQPQKESQQKKINQPYYDPYTHHNQHQHHEKHAPHQQESHFSYDNPNDYYRNQAEQAKDSINSPNLINKELPTQPPSSTQAESLTETKNGKMESKGTDANSGTASIEMITPTTPSPVHNTMESKETDVNFGTASIKVITPTTPSPVHNTMESIKTDAISGTAAIEVITPTTPSPVHNTMESKESDPNLGTASIEMLNPTTPTPVHNTDASKEANPTYVPIQNAENSQNNKLTHIPINNNEHAIDDSSIDVPETIPTLLPTDEKRDAGLFTTILGTVNNFVTKLRKQPQTGEIKVSNTAGDDELQRILYPNHFVGKNILEGDDEYCEKLSPHHCPKRNMDSTMHKCHFEWSNINMDNFVDVFVTKAFEMRELLSCLTIVSSTVLLFLFGYYCFCNNSREGALISKLNLLERSLLASHKENAIIKDDLLKTRHKLTSIEDNSFGSNDMVIALKKELEINAEEKHQLQEQIHSLEKELETAAEAGLELNKIVAELLNNQTGQESIIMNSVEDLQMQFNEQQKTILEINANLAEKSRENSELQLMLAEQNVRFSGEIASLQQDNDELEAEKSNLKTRLEDLKAEFEEDISKALEGKNVEIKRLQNEIIDLNNRYEDMHTKWQTSLAKIEALEDCMKKLKKDSNVNINELINVANVRAELLDLQKQRSSLKTRLDTETEARQHAENSLQTTITEIDKLKQVFNQSEKDKLEAQTRLEVLSNYFKEKETQLQKELSLKEAIWLKQQGENTSTVDRLTAMQDEIQSLKSQNDALRAEIEAQLAAHKAQTGTLENRAHETWLAARQSERRFEEARAEAAALRRRLTELAGAANSGAAVDGKLTVADFNNAPSPILPPTLLDASASSPLLGTLPPPPHQFLPFMGPPPPPFMNLPPPPPFMQTAEMRPAPLGRMMSPTSGRYSPPPPPQDRARKRRDNDYYEHDYDDYDDDDDDDDDYDAEEDDYDYDDERVNDRGRRPRRRSGNGSDSEWQRDKFSPPPPDRSYRSQSPTDSRYNYTYDEETDLSPPPSPNHGRRRGGTGSYHTYSPRLATNSSSSNVIQEKMSKKANKGIPNSDSDKSHNSARHNKKVKSMV